MTLESELMEARDQLRAEMLGEVGEEEMPVEPNYFSRPDTPPVETPVEAPSEEAQTEVEIPAEEPVVPVDDELVEVAGYRLHPDQARQIIEASRWIEQNPERWAQIEAQMASQQPAILPEPTSSEDEEYLDPAVLQLRQEIAEIRSAMNQRLNRDFGRAVRRGYAVFQEAHPDTNEDLLTELTTYIRTYDTLPKHIEIADDEVEGTVNALESAYRTLTYDRIRQEAASDVVRQMSARRNAAAATSTPSSAPRVDPAPQTSEDRKNALISELAKAMAEPASS